MPVRRCGGQDEYVHGQVPKSKEADSRVRERWGRCLFGWVPMGSRLHDLGILALSGKTGE